MGILILGAFSLYLLLATAVVISSIKFAKRNGHSAKRWGWGAALIMFLIPFWDWLPTVAAHQYYCATEAGFWEYKTLDQWNKENPGAMAELVAKNVLEYEKINGSNKAMVNQRIAILRAEKSERLLNRWPDIRELIDTKTNSVLARYVDFSTSQEKQQAGWNGWKIWLSVEHCPGGEERAMAFVNYYRQFRGN